MSVDDGHTSFNSEDLREGIGSNIIQVNVINTRNNTDLLKEAKEMSKKDMYWSYVNLSQQNLITVE